MKFTRVTSIAAAVLIVLPAATAFGHADFVPSSVGTDDAVLVTLTIPHDCATQGTTSIEAEIPEEIATFTPLDAPGWTITTTTAKAEVPSEDEHAEHSDEEHAKAMHAGATGERTESVKWVHDGGPLEHPLAAGFQALVAVGDAKAGDAIHVPVIQSCPKGQSISWIDTPAKGEGMDDLEYPAPMLVVADAANEPNPHAHGTSDEKSAAAEDHDESAEADAKGDEDAADEKEDEEEDDAADRAQLLSGIGIGLGAFALLIALLALRKRK